MDANITSKRGIIAFGFLGLAYLSIFLLFNVNLIENELSGISWALSLDLLLTLPLIYLAIIWKSDIPKTTVVPIVIIGLIVGYQIIPTSEQFILDGFKQWILPVIEIAIFAFVIFKIRSISKSLGKKSETIRDTYDLIRSTVSEIIPGRVGVMVSAEIAVMYYGFINWKTYAIGPNEFSYHKRSGSPSLFYALLMIIAVETFALHVVVIKWSVVAAWILTVLSVYSAFQIFGIARSFSKRPIVIDEGELYLKYGILAELKIRIEDITEVELSRRFTGEDKHVQRISPLGELEAFNTILYLKQNYIIHGMYGFKKDVKTLLLHVDEKEHFKSSIEKLINSDSKDLNSNDE